MWQHELLSGADVQMRGEMFRNSFRRMLSLTGIVGPLCVPWLMLIGRIWLGQAVFLHRIVMMMEADHGPPAALDAAVHSLAPLLLAAGLMTRPVAVGLMTEAAWSSNALASNITGPEAALLACLVVMGPGALSLDRLFGHGLLWIPLRMIGVLRQCYTWLEVVIGPLLRLGVRVGAAIAILTPTLHALAPVGGAMLGGPAASLSVPGWCAILFATSLTIGCATRLTAFILACMVPMGGVNMSIDDRFAVILLFLMLTACGAGILSLDFLLSRRFGRRSELDGELGDNLPHIVVVGGGFGGVATVRGLRGSACRITLIDQRNHHLFQPLLYQVATAALSPGDIATPLRSLFRDQPNVRVYLGEVTDVDVAAREVILGATRIGFDTLVLATGARHSYFGQEQWASFAPGLKSIEDATSIRSRLLQAFEEAENSRDEAERLAWLTFVIVGGGPTGIELAGAIAELARHGMEKEFSEIDPASTDVILLQSQHRILPNFDPRLSAAAERSLRNLGVDVRLGARVENVDDMGVDVGPQRIAARTVLWAAGVTASAAAKWLREPCDSSGRLVVEPDLSVPGLPRVYAIGDTASSNAWRGKSVPGLAPAAKQQGQYVARVIAARLAGKPNPHPFRYKHFGSLATIGRQAAVAELGRLRLWGAPAWWFWGAAHVAFLVGGRNKLTVILNWIWAYATYRRSARLITYAAARSALDVSTF